MFFCKYPWEHEAVFAREIRNRLTEETGVDLSNGIWVLLPHSNFPYNKFLKNANEKAKEVYRSHLNYLCSI